MPYYFIDERWLRTVRCERFSCGGRGIVVNLREQLAQSHMNSIRETDSYIKRDSLLATFDVGDGRTTKADRSRQLVLREIARDPPPRAPEPLTKAPVEIHSLTLCLKRETGTRQ